MHIKSWSIWSSTLANWLHQFFYQTSTARKGISVCMQVLENGNKQIKKYICAFHNSKKTEIFNINVLTL